jgi:hypothetical protein
VGWDRLTNVIVAELEVWSIGYWKALRVFLDSTATRHDVIELNVYN